MKSNSGQASERYLVLLGINTIDPLQQTVVESYMSHVLSIPLCWGIIVFSTTFLSSTALFSMSALNTHVNYLGYCAFQHLIIFRKILVKIWKKFSLVIWVNTVLQGVVLIMDTIFLSSFLPFYSIILDTKEYMWYFYKLQNIL